MRKFLLTIAVALTIATPSLAQEHEPASGETPAWLKSLGNFVREGVTPPRTAADVAREDEERRQKAREAAREAERKAVLVQPVPAPVEAQPEPAPPPAVEAAPRPAKPEPAAVTHAPPAPAPAAALHAAPEASPGPLALPLPKARPKMVVPVIQPPPAPVPATERIAGTATLDQAIKLGGTSDLYGQRIKKPKRD